jgi:hypothetical protein
MLFAPCEVLVLVLMEFALSFFFWTYFSDNSIVCKNSKDSKFF